MQEPKRERRERSLMLGAATLLLIDTFLPWQRLSFGRFSYSWNAWHGDKGVLLGSLTVVLVAWIAVRMLGVGRSTRIPEARATLWLAVLVLAFAAVKNIHDDYSTWPSYAGVVIAGGVVVAAWQSDVHRDVASRRD